MGWVGSWGSSWGGAVQERGVPLEVTGQLVGGVRAVFVRLGAGGVKQVSYAGFRAWPTLTRCGRRLPCRCCSRSCCSSSCRGSHPVMSPLVIGLLVVGLQVLGPRDRCEGPWSSSCCGIHRSPALLGLCRPGLPRWPLLPSCFRHSSSASPVPHRLRSSAAGGSLALCGTEVCRGAMLASWARCRWCSTRR